MLFLKWGIITKQNVNAGSIMWKNVINKLADGGRHCKEKYGSDNIEFFNKQKLTSIKYNGKLF